MIRNMDITNSPRRCGKTTWLQKELAEALIRNEYEKYIIIVPTESMRRMWVNYLYEKLFINTKGDQFKGFIEVIKPNLPSSIGRSLFDKKSALVLIDEYDMLNEVIQTKTIHDLEKLNCDCDVIARGTLLERGPILFKDFLNG